MLILSNYIKLWDNLLLIVGQVKLRRKSIRMFAEGSVFLIQPEGELADVTDPRFTNHLIYRSGISVSLPIIHQNY